MFLRVPASEFARAAREECGVQRGYVIGTSTGSLLSAGGRGVVVHAASPASTREAKEALADEGFAVAAGLWSLNAGAEPLLDDDAPAYVTAVAYATGGEKPGVWMDAAPASRPTGDVLGRVYAEFAEAGEVGELTYDEFIAAANPTVIELSPEEIRRMCRRHTESPAS